MRLSGAAGTVYRPAVKLGFSLLTLVLGLNGFMGAASAAEPEGESAASEASAKEDDGKAGATKADGAAPAAAAASLDHKKQFGLRVALVVPYRMVLRYDDSPYCHSWMDGKGPNDQPKFCGFLAPLALDLGLSFAASGSLEPFVWARFGLAAEKETSTAPQVVVGGGARIYTMADEAFKIYVEPALGVGLEGEGEITDSLLNGKSYGTDLLLHFAAGPQFDLHKNFGIYADAGLTVGVLRALSASLEAKFGVQGRLP